MADLANNPRTVETTAASANPGIISALSGASNSAPTPMSPPPQAPAPAPSNPGLPNAVTGVVPQGAINAATQMGEQLYNRPFLKQGEAASDAAIKQLFSYDQMLDKGYSPFPQVQGYVENPADLYNAGASFAGGMGGISKGMNSAVSTVESGYQAAISGILDKFTQFYQLQQQREEKEKEREYQKKKDQFETEITLAKMTGGVVTNPWTGEKIHVESDLDRELKKLRASNASSSGRSIADILGLGGAKTGSTPTASSTTPAYSPGRAGISETVGGKSFVSNAKGGWDEVGQPTQSSSNNPMGLDRNKIIAALSVTTNPKEYERLSDLLTLVPSGGASKDQIANANQLRDEYNKQSTDFIKIRDSYNRILSSGDNAAGDLGLIYGYMKILDPGSTVREGEFATAANSAGVPDRIKIAYNKALSGERLNPTLRKEFKGQAESIYKVSEAQHKSTIDEYSRLAQQLGLDPSMVIVNVGQAQGIGQQNSGTMRVRLKSSGKTGTIPIGEFDPNIYERI